ncbi:MAG: undecaprenyl-phosphate glucose phosphotransferase [Bacteroidales bacterium]|nr:undecaprenyl-phosphate glucose phosphotransferase [Bacteroidales bacterium]
MKLTGRSFGKYLTGLFSVADLLLVNLLFGLTLLLCPEVAHIPRIKTLWVLVNTSYLPVMLWVRGKPHQQRVLLMDHVLKGAFTVVGIHALFFLSLNAFLEIDVPLRGYLVFYALMVVGIPLWWIISRRIIKALRRRGYNFTRVAIVGTGPTAQRLAQEIQSDAGFGYKVLGFFSDNPEPDFPGHVLGSLSDMREMVRELKVDQIFYTLSGNDEKSYSTAVRAADDNVIQFYYVPQVSMRVPRSFELWTIGQMPVLSIRRNPLNSPINRGLKRAFDFTFSSVLLLFSPIVFIPVAIAIKMTSPGPIFFKQERTGYKGRTFKCWKFRTMRQSADANTRQATRHDDRTTRLGAFMRRTSIDELPQFINVWKGDMSVVGPRPHMLKHTEDYTKLISEYMVRHLVKPGITGWAQVKGYRGITDELWKMERRVECDVWYIEHWSLFLDIKIVIRTVMNAFRGEENAF